MTVEQMIDALQRIPKRVVVLVEGDTGYSLIAGMTLEETAMAAR